MTVLASLTLVFLCLFALWVWSVFPSTLYAAGYSEESFNSLKIGDSAEHIIKLMGEPIERRKSIYPVCFEFSNDIIGYRTYNSNDIICSKKGLGKPPNITTVESFRVAQEIYGPCVNEKRLGFYEFWEYSKSADFHNYLQRTLVIDLRQNVLVDKIKKLYVD